MHNRSASTSQGHNSYSGARPVGPLCQAEAVGGFVDESFDARSSPIEDEPTVTTLASMLADIPIGREEFTTLNAESGARPVRLAHPTHR